MAMCSEPREEIALTAWQLFYVANALTRAKRLEKMRLDFHQELYDSITCRTTDYEAELNPTQLNMSTEAQAIRIIEAKERYDRLIQVEHERDMSWCKLLSWANDKDKILMVRYFKDKKYVKPEIVNALLERINERVVEEEIKVEEHREKRARQQYTRYLNTVGRKHIRKQLKVFDRQKNNSDTPRSKVLQK